MSQILKGMRVGEGSAFVAVPLAGMTLAQMGADVIRFDRIQGGLDAQRWPVAPNGESLFWAGLNKGKRSVAVDMKSPRGKELITEIITAPGEDAGLFLTNLRVRGWMDYETLSQHRADLVMVTLQGDRHGRPAVDYTVNAAIAFRRRPARWARRSPSLMCCRPGTASPAISAPRRFWPPSATG